MNKIVCCMLGMIALSVTAVQAAGPASTVVPEPMPELSAQPYGQHVASNEILVFENVRYKRQCKIAPCSSPKMVTIVDPCAPKRSCCEPGCVAVEICAPDCACECVRCSKDGRRKVFDYGKYSVVVQSHRGKVTVTYRS